MGARASPYPPVPPPMIMLALTETICDEIFISVCDSDSPLQCNKRYQKFVMLLIRERLASAGPG